MNFDSIINSLNSMRVSASIAANSAVTGEKTNSTNADGLTADSEHFSNARDTLEFSLDNLSDAKSALADISIASAVMKITANDIKVNPRYAMLAQANINPDVVAKLIQP